MWTGVQPVRERMKKALQKSETTRQDIILFDSKLRNNMDRSSTSMYQSLAMLVVCVVIWFVLEYAGVRTIGFFGMTFQDFSVPLLVLPPITAFFYYRYACFLFNCTMIEASVWICQEHLFKPFREEAVDRLALCNRGFLDTESMLADVEKENNVMKRITQWWRIVSMIISWIIPIVILIFIAYGLISSPSINLGWSIASLVVTMALVLRGLFILVYISRALG